MAGTFSRSVIVDINTIWSNSRILLNISPTYGKYVHTIQTSSILEELLY